MAVQFADILKIWGNLQSLDWFFSHLDIPSYRHHADKFKECKELIEKIANDSGCLNGCLNQFENKKPRTAYPFTLEHLMPEAREEYLALRERAKQEELEKTDDSKEASS